MLSRGVRDLRRLELLEVTGGAKRLERGVDGRGDRGLVAGVDGGRIDGTGLGHRPSLMSA